MAFIKYEVEQPNRPQIKINSTTISVSEQDWSNAGLDGTEFVNLYWDAKGSQVGLSSTTSDDKSKFPIRKSRRGISIAAKKFFNKFGLSEPQAEGGLTETGDVIAFKVKSSSSTVAKVVSIAPAADGLAAPKRRGRRPKNYVAS